MKYLNIFLVITLFTFASCSEDETPETTALRINMTDAPGDYNEVNIDLQQVEIKMKHMGSWMNVTTNAGIYDLLELTNGIDTTIVNDSVPVGEIQMLRFILGPNNTVMVDSTVYPLATPSAMQSGLKLNLNRVLNPYAIDSLLIDFDADSSIVDHGNGTYSLRPVLKVVN